MKVHVLFNFVIQIFMVLVSADLFFYASPFKFMLSLLLAWMIFIPSFIENIRKDLIKSLWHYAFTIFSLILFIFLIVF